MRPNTFSTRRPDGFSLLELSIVLIIIGPLAGGVVAGKHLIRGAEIQSVLTDLTTIKTSIHEFKDKYNMLPGDMENATKFWGRADGGANLDQNCANPLTNINPANLQATCNGNGDEILAESFRFWQHLSNAGYIHGRYTGVPGPNASNFEHIPSVNCLEARTSGIGYTVADMNPTPPDWLQANQKGRYIEVGLPNGTHGTVMPAFTVSETMSIDQKLDDGAPGTGIIHTYLGSIQPCVTSDNPVTAQYNPSASGTVCAVKYTIR